MPRNSVAGKRGGAGGRGAPPDVYSPFVDIPEGEDADPLGAVGDAIKWLIYLVLFGWIIRICKVVLGIGD